MVEALLGQAFGVEGGDQLRCVPAADTRCSAVRPVDDDAHRGRAPGRDPRFGALGDDEGDLHLTAVQQGSQVALLGGAPGDVEVAGTGEAVGEAA